MRNQAVWLCAFLVLLQAGNVFSQTSQYNATAVLLGDSEMIGFENYPQFLPKDTANLAVGGARTVDTSRDASRAVGYNPKSVFILTGTADSLVGDIDSVSNHYGSIIESVQSLLPNTKIYALALFPQNVQTKPLVDNINATIKKVIGTNSNTVFLDFTPSFAAPDGSLKSEFNLDGVHLNQSGYKLWGELLAPYF